MQIAEIQVSYSLPVADRVKVLHSRSIYEVLIQQWALDSIEFIEEAKMILLNRANIILGIYNLSKGGITGTIVDLRVVLAIALKCNASAIILAHNHPSGNLQPSEQDKVITKKLREASKLLDLVLLDHLIISKNSYYSFADDGTL
jgi:DNA repair protein RadC